MWRFVAARASIFAHAGSAVAESRPIFTAVMVLLDSSITRTRREGHTSLFALSVVNRAGHK
ncbi:MAG: hypothetical protein DMF16_00100 [Verrucomicrobia bacterium]|nr:MAG: hypothetical protein DMF16_00100 [Verrucomicrobiota bacterium]